MKLMQITTLSLCVAVCGSAHANLFINGDFEASNTGFSTNYTYRSSGVVHGYEYAIGTDAADHHNPGVWASFGDHTTGKGNYMIVNGNFNDFTIPRVWQQSLILDANTDYTFSFWATSVIEDAPAQLTMFANGLVGPTYTLDTVGEWTQYTFNFNSGLGGHYTLGLVDQDMTSYGNDFALDDFYLAEANPVPEPASMLALSAGATAFLARRRRKKQA